MKAPHVVLDSNKNEMRCNHCGETESMQTLVGKRIGFACGIMDAFVKDHVKCEKKL